MPGEIVNALGGHSCSEVLREPTLPSGIGCRAGRSFGLGAPASRSVAELDTAVLDGVRVGSFVVAPYQHQALVVRGDPHEGFEVGHLDHVDRDHPVQGGHRDQRPVVPGVDAPTLPAVRPFAGGGQCGKERGEEEPNV